MVSNYTSDLDATPELDANYAQYFQELIGMSRWATEISRVDVLHEISFSS